MLVKNFCSILSDLSMSVSSYAEGLARLRWENVQRQKFINDRKRWIQEEWDRLLNEVYDHAIERFRPHWLNRRVMKVRSNGDCPRDCPDELMGKVLTIVKIDIETLPSAYVNFNGVELKDENGQIHRLEAESGEDRLTSMRYYGWVLIDDVWCISSPRLEFIKNLSKDKWLNFVSTKVLGAKQRSIERVEQQAKELSECFNKYPQMTLKERRDALQRLMWCRTMRTYVASFAPELVQELEKLES